MERPDFSSYLTHFTRERTGSTGFEVLVEILTQGTITASRSGVMGKNKPKASCFTEIPERVFSDVLVPPDSRLDYGFFRPYGISFSKEEGLRAGIRPVIYVPKEDIGNLAWIDSFERWRIVHMMFDFQREWRANGDINLAEIRRLTIYVWTEEEVSCLKHVLKNSPLNILAITALEHLRTNK